MPFGIGLVSADSRLPGRTSRGSIRWIAVSRQIQARGALEKLCRATRITLYWELCKEHYRPEGQDAWDEVETAKAESEVWINEGESVWVELSDEHPRVRAAERALRELDGFLTDDKQLDFVEELTEDGEFPIKLSNKEFWRNGATRKSWLSAQPVKKVFNLVLPQLTLIFYFFFISKIFYDQNCLISNF